MEHDETSENITVTDKLTGQVKHLKWNLKSEVIKCIIWLKGRHILLAKNVANMLCFIYAMYRAIQTGSITSFQRVQNF